MNDKTKHPNETIFLSKDKVEKAIQIAKEIREFVTRKMNIKIDYNSVIDSY